MSRVWHVASGQTTRVIFLRAVCRQLAMTKRKCEQKQLLASLLPPCKKSLLNSRGCSLDPVRVEKRRLEPDSAPSLQADLHDPDCDRVQPPTSSPPCKKLRAAEAREGPSPDYKCQKDEAFCEYNSFQYWRTPLPAFDLSELATDPGEVTASDASVVTDIQEMDS